MLARSLILAVSWLVLSSVALLLRGTRVRQASPWRGYLWLIVVIACGDMWALLTFGEAAEVTALSGIALLSGVWWIRRLPNWNALGQATWILSVLATLLYLIYSFAVTAFTPLHPIGFFASCVLVSIELLALLLSLTFLYETLDVCTRVRWHRRFGPAQPIAGYAPKVSLHVPAYNEPPEIVEATLRSLAQLNYANYEVLVVDNNTPDETTWRPLEKICRELGPRFKCLHLDRWPGYKSGALNFALTQTALDAEIVGVIDADYQVTPNYLRETVPYFHETRVAFLQTPQDYRDYQGSTYLKACYDAYKYFFDVSMPSRNEHNAIIFGGTMGLIRKTVLQAIGGWDEWCITEDAEASLRILKLGYESVYINRAYGYGLMPLNFEGLKKQRFRWCFGGIQILRKHWEALMPWAQRVEPQNRLTPAQRYYYLAGGAQWFNEVLTLIFTVLLLLGGLAVIFTDGIGVRPLLGAVVIVPVVFLTLGVWRFGWALHHALHIDQRSALRAMSSFFSLSWVVALACLQGLVQPRGVFLRTPKTRARSNMVRALRATQWETTLGLACAGIGVAVVIARPSLNDSILMALLLWQATVFLMAPTYSVLSLRGAQPARLVSRGDIQGRFMPEAYAARWALALTAMLMLCYGLLRLLPQPAEVPQYAKYQPAELQPQELIGLPPVPTATPTARPSPTTSDITLAPTRTAAALPTPTPSAQPPAHLLPSMTASPVRPTPATTQPPLSTAATTPASPPTVVFTPTPILTLVPTSKPLPVPSSSPLPVPSSTPRPLPTQEPTQPPLPTQVPTQRPLPTQVPTHPPLPTQIPTQPPPPTQPPQPTHIPTPTRRP